MQAMRKSLSDLLIPVPLAVVTSSVVVVFDSDMLAGTRFNNELGGKKSCGMLGDGAGDRRLCCWTVGDEHQLRPRVKGMQ